jgi:Tfp pilus assembly protein PilX
MRADRQTGVALIGVLGLIMAGSVAALTVMDSAAVQHRLAAGAADRRLAMSLAIAAIEQGHRRSASLSVPTASAMPPRAAAWQQRLEDRGTALPAINRGAAAPPRVIVERLRRRADHPCGHDNPCGHRVTALAEGRNPSVRVVLQSIRLADSTTRIRRELR